MIASGGNAGLAAACAANALQVKCTVYLPEGATQTTKDLLRRHNAEVIVAGNHYAEALKVAQSVVDRDLNASVRLACCRISVTKKHLQSNGSGL